MEAKEKYDFPYDMDFVLKLDLPTAKLYNGGSKEEVCLDCPLCGKKRKLYINRAKSTFYCQSANCVGHEGGGVLKLHQLLTGLPDTKAAMKELSKAMKGLTEEEKKALEERKKSASKCSADSEMKAANIETRNAVYDRMLDNLSLAVIDRTDLIKRGLNDEAIKKFKIKSTPVLVNSIARKMLGDNYDFCVAEYAKYGSNIPGLYYCDHEIKMVKLKPGILIPVIDRNGRIAMCQIRRRPLPKNATQAQKDNYHKYSQLASSWKDTGCNTNGIVKIHHVGFDFENDGLPTKHTPAQVCLTEGCLKADVASFLENNKAYIAVLGVNNLKSLPDEFKWLFEHGTRSIRLRFDMDFIDNAAVSKAYYDVNDMLQELGVVSVVFYPKDEKIMPCFNHFKKIMAGDKDHKSLPYVVIQNGKQLKRLSDEGKIVVFNDFWDPEYKGIDDYMLHCSEQFK